MWLKLGENTTILIRNQSAHSYGASNIDEKWSKNHDDLMCPYRVIPPQSSKKKIADISIFHERYTAITLQGCTRSS